VKRIVIIGGGISGLAAAAKLVELCQQSHQELEILLFEAGPRLGGVIHTDHRDGFLIEAGPDSFISEKPEALALAKRVGLGDRLIQTNSEHRRSFIVRGGKLRPVPEGFHLLAPASLWSFITSDIISWTGKARMAWDLFAPRASGPNGDESLASFVRRRLGNEALTRIAQPMVGGIYTADPEMLSLRATMPRFLEMEREHGSLIRAMRANGAMLKQRSGVSGARCSLFLSFDLGMQMLVDRLTEIIANFRLPIADLNSHGVHLHTSVESIRLEKRSEDESPRWRIITGSHVTTTADAVCLALPAYAAARLLRNVDPSLASDLEAIPYASTATVNLAYRGADIAHPLDGFGFVVPFVEKRTLLACTFSSVKFAGRAPKGYALLRAFVGGALQPEMFELEEDEMIQGVRNDLRELLGVEKPPFFSVVERWPRSMPQYHVGHIERVRRIEDRLPSLPGLFLAGGAYHGPGIPDCIRSGEAAAGRIFSRSAIANGSSRRSGR
jgi:oxygen-dependent protoporphyrinogen oxidase